ncbi:hypothetical protein THAOC_23533, partial [Thalassiosira oceanica]
MERQRIARSGHAGFTNRRFSNGYLRSAESQVNYKYVQMDVEALNDGLSPNIHRSMAVASHGPFLFMLNRNSDNHSFLLGLGDLVTSAFAADGEVSGLNFSQDLLDQLAESSPHLRGVWLQAKSLNDVDIRDLCHALIQNRVVTEVWLPGNHITDVGASYIAHMLKFNRTIK